MTYPEPYASIRNRYSDLVKAYDALGDSAYGAGPLEPKEQRLVKLALAIGAGLEGAVHSHARRALEAGLSPDALRHTALLATTTLGFPAMVRAMTWIEDMLAKKPTAVPGEG